MGDDDKWQGGKRVKPDAPPAPEDPSDPQWNDSAWAQIDVPHDFVVQGSFDPSGPASHGFLPTNTSWYRKTFDLPAEWEDATVWIEFDGVYRDSTLWLNGVLLGKHSSGYTSFRFELG